MTPAEPARKAGREPHEDPDVPDAAGLVWCASCQRRVPPAVRALHRGQALPPATADDLFDPVRRGASDGRDEGGTNWLRVRW